MVARQSPYTSQNSASLVRKKRSGGSGSNTPLHSDRLCCWSTLASAAGLTLSVALLRSGTCTQAGARHCGRNADCCSDVGWMSAPGSPCQARAAGHAGRWACVDPACCGAAHRSSRGCSCAGCRQGGCRAGPPPGCPAAGCRPAAQNASTRVVRLPAWFALPAEQPMPLCIQVWAAHNKTAHSQAFEAPSRCGRWPAQLHFSGRDARYEAHQGARRAAGCRRRRPAALAEDRLATPLMPVLCLAAGPKQLWGRQHWSGTGWCCTPDVDTAPKMSAGFPWCRDLEKHVGES